MVITVGEHRIRPIHQCYTIEYMQRDKSGNPNGKWHEASFYPTRLEDGLVKLMELEVKRRGRGCQEADTLIGELRAMRTEIAALGSV